MTSMLLGSNLRRCIPCMALLVVLSQWCAQAADDEALQVPLRREDPAPYRPPAHDRLVFKAPPSQLFEPWRCAWPATSGNPWAVVPCRSYDHPEINPYTGYSNDLLQDPFAPLRYLSQPYPLRPPRAGGEPVPGAPPSQLPNGRSLPLGPDYPSPQLLLR